MKLVFSISFILITILILAFFFMSYGQLKEGISDQRIVEIQETAFRPFFKSELESEKLKVLSWNIAWAHGPGSDGVNYRPKSKEYYQERLKKIAALIKEQDADIVFLQEVDFDSARSFHIDQAQFLARAAGYPHLAYAPSWKINHVPFPYWPPRRQFGRILSGGVLLSRFTILENQVSLYPKPKANPWWYNVFYLFRYSQKVKLKISDKEVEVINTHLESWDAPNRMAQAKHLAERIKSNPKIILSVGDYNSIDSHFKKRDNFDPPYNNEDYSLNIVGRMIDMSGFKASYNIEDDSQKVFTFPATKPDRRLDYILYHPQLKLESSYTIPFKELLSDHLPISATFVLRL